MHFIQVGVLVKGFLAGTPSSVWAEQHPPFTFFGVAPQGGIWVLHLQKDLILPHVQGNVATWSQ